jgi:diamine N-acetyltransferase
MKAFDIRRAGPGDANLLARLGAATFTETFGHLYPPQDLAAFLAEAHASERVAADLADPAKALWLALADDEAVGYALAGPCDLPHPEVTSRCGELKRLYLLTRWQNYGLGRSLFDEAITWLQAGGPRDVWLGVWSENLGAQRFYRRAGFEQVGEYGFRVGATLDREFILRRSAHASSN